MNENYWEQAKKAHSKRLVWITFVIVSLTIVFLIIFFNNKDILSEKTDIKKNTSIGSDSGLVDFSTPDSDIDHFFGSPDTSSILNQISENEEKGISDTAENSKKVVSVVQQPEVKPVNSVAKIEKIPENPPKKTNKLASTGVISKTDSLKINEMSGNIKTTNGYSILLPNVESMVSDRKDIIIRLALELFYNDPADTRGILSKRDPLRVVARKVIQRKELNSIRKESLSDEFENEMNTIFDKKTLQKVIVREFHIEKVDVQ
jgi:hypothetical protein